MLFCLPHSDVKASTTRDILWVGVYAHKNQMAVREVSSHQAICLVGVAVNLALFGRGLLAHTP